MTKILKTLLPLLLIMILVSCQKATVQKNRSTTGQLQPDINIIGFGGNLGPEFILELATSAEQKSQGLMNRSTLAQNHGMLFMFEYEHQLRFWMKNTLIPLDIIFMNKDWRVVYIAKKTTPLSLEPISSNQPAIYALEINGGLADQLGISVGTVARPKIKL